MVSTKEHNYLTYDYKKDHNGIRPYQKAYHQWSSLVSAIKRKKHFYLFTTDNKQRNILKVFADVNLSDFVATFLVKKETFTLIQERVDFMSYERFLEMREAR